jgi:hypothetical protein
VWSNPYVVPAIGSFTGEGRRRVTSEILGRGIGENMTRVFVKQESEDIEIRFTLVDAGGSPGADYPHTPRAKVRITSNVDNGWGEQGWEQIVKAGESVIIAVQE